MISSITECSWEMTGYSAFQAAYASDTSGSFLDMTAIWEVRDEVRDGTKFGTRSSGRTLDTKFGTYVRYSNSKHIKNSDSPINLQNKVTIVPVC
jgi:hypothetical protein